MAVRTPTLAHVNFPNKAVLLFGSRGQLGSRIKEHLSNNGVQVFEPVYFSEGDKPLPVKRVNLVETLSQGSIGIVINASSPNAKFASHNRNLVEEWVKSRLSDLVEIMRNLSKGHLIHLSTVQVYGENPHGTLNESSPLLGTSVYPQMHISMERKICRIDRSTILRLGNIYGRPGPSGQISWELFTHEIARKFAINHNATIFSNPAQKRDFVPTQFLLHGIKQIIKTEALGVFNITTGETRSLRFWGEIVADRAGSIFGINNELFFATPDSPVLDFSYDCQRLNKIFVNSLRLDELIMDELDDLLRFVAMEAKRVK